MGMPRVSVVFWSAMHHSAIYGPVDEIEDIRRRMRISNLEARLALHEIEAAALTHEIKSPLTSAKRRNEAIERRDVVLIEVSVITAELEQMRRSFPLLARH
jgi:hypothetical protein